MLYILQEEKPLRDAHLTDDELKMLNSFQLLSVKPMLIALNLDESQVSETGKYLDELVKKKLSAHTKALFFFGKIEQEMSELPEKEAQIFMNEYGIKESALDSIIREAYDLLGLQSFFTCGEQECRAWTIKKGSTAQEAAGEIHTDFYNKFIRAETVGYDDFSSAGTFAKAREQGTWRLEGKEYIVKDGDILIIRHG
jgi:ribosome-binding ATPase YchF (GTP1/OBG family)